MIEEDLKPNGRNIDVTEANKKEYIEWVSVQAKPTAVCMVYAVLVCLIDMMHMYLHVACAIKY